MNGLYTETTVKKYTSFKTKLAITMWIIATLYMFVFTLFTTGISLKLLVLIDIILMIVFIPNMVSKDYEYIFCDGQIDIDVIKRGRKRKHLKRYDLVNADLFAPIHDPKIKEYVIDWKKDFTSGRGGDRVYGIIFRFNDRYALLKIEPSLKMIWMAKQKMPRKTIILPEHEEQIKQENFMLS